MYPILIYLGLKTFSPVALVILVLVFLAARAIILTGSSMVLDRGFRVITVITAVLVMAGFVVDPEIAVKVYPVSVSLGFAIVFSYSLIKPPSMIERFARIQQSDLSNEGVIYTRKITLIWISFFVFNAFVSGWTALFQSREIWALYNGLIAYIVIGILIGGEIFARKFLGAGQR